MALSSINTEGLCGIEYIYWPISAYRKLIYSKVLSKIVAGDDVLDLGCGQAGIYWALSYALKCKSMSFFDYHKENLEQLNNQIALISPEYLEEKFADTLDFLEDAHLIPANTTKSEIAEQIIEKVSAISEYDFTSLTTDKKFDAIICIESIECVNSFDDLVRVASVCNTMLNPGGQLLGASLRYNEATERTKELVRMHFEGELNPDQDQLKRAFVESGFQNVELETIATPELYNYGQVVLFNCLGSERK